MMAFPEWVETGLSHKDGGQLWFGTASTAEKEAFDKALDQIERLKAHTSTLERTSKNSKKRARRIAKAKDAQVRALGEKIEELTGTLASYRFALEEIARSGDEFGDLAKEALDEQV